MTDENDGAAGVNGDAELIAAVRGGDAAAFDVLYRRHVDAARRMARGLSRDAADVDDLVAESFARMLSILRSGGGPDVAFRPYLLTTVRHLFYESVKRARKLQVTDNLSNHEPGVPFVDTAVEKLELTLISRAFAKLPERWQTVLWHTEVEQERPATVAPILGISPNGVAALAYRAREGLRQQYLQEHLLEDPDEECRLVVSRLGAYVRSGLSSRDRASTEAHLDDCARCHLLFVELNDVNAGLRGLLGPALLAGSVSGYFAAGTQTVALPMVTWWTPIRRIAKRRSSQAVAATAVLAGLVALALVLSSQSSPVTPAAPGVDPPRPTAPVVTPPAQPSASVAPPGVTPPPPATPESTSLEVTLVPVSGLVRGRPGALALSVINRGKTVAFGPRGLSQRRAVDTGPLTAMITVPAGVSLRTGAPGDGWTCANTSVPTEFKCARASLPAGQTSRSFVPVNVSGTASDGVLRVRLTAPHATATSATALGKMQPAGLSATFAAQLPATVVTGGNTLMTCPLLMLGCLSARYGGSLLGGINNGDYHMTGYADPAAPQGTPAHSWVSGATIAVRGKVAWAGLYWSGSGPAPSLSRAHLLVPGKNAYQSVDAQRIDRVSGADFTQPAYQASADVTALVRGSSGGSWWVAVDHGAFASGPGSYGGWALVIVVEDGGPLRTVTVLDGFVPMRGTQSISTAIYGRPGAEARFAFVGWEGDRGLSGDQLKVGGQPAGGGDATNIAASRADGTAAGWNTFGVDTRCFTGKIPAAPGDVTATNTTDAWILGTVAIASVTGP
ncbi:sigma-70 family RNA polymerase sigma factor [Catelliglobosispora koreensis]|uniref:sigma-70 family RNA polymerase sigma factor n=1 Tax=Catelliglobosispora koreensis TaxID=129052 RepID=UPI00037CAA8E|nr:sigma-70 family RNA polymerase sigma factor [Catelliglobosispora koreensis]